MSTKAKAWNPDAQRLISSLPLAVVLLEPGLRIASVNPAAEQLFGQSSRRLIGRMLDEIMAFNDPHLIERIRDSDGAISAREISVSLAGQGMRGLDMTFSPVVDFPDWHLLTLHDNSASEALGEDSGGTDAVSLRGPEILAHEIKNPLAGIRGAAQLLGRKVDPKEAHLTDLIAAEVDRIALLIDQMQTLSRRTAAPVDPCNLHESVRRARAVFNAADAQATKAPPRIEEEFDPSLPPVLGNSDALVQVLINLISNAREACIGQPGARIIMRTRFASGLQLRLTESGAPVSLPVELRISDNGPGVDPAMREHIFEPFVTSKKSGQGLGLPLVRKLIRDMNGRITHERDEANGWTHFRIHLPLAEQPRRKAREKALQA